MSTWCLTHLIGVIHLFPHKCLIGASGATIDSFKSYFTELLFIINKWCQRECRTHCRATAHTDTSPTCQPCEELWTCPGHTPSLSDDRWIGGFDPVEEKHVASRKWMDGWIFGFECFSVTHHIKRLLYLLQMSNWGYSHLSCTLSCPALVCPPWVLCGMYHWKSIDSVN